MILLHLGNFFKPLIISFISFILLISCQKADLNTYRYNEVGKTSAVTFGTVLKKDQ